MKGIDGLVIGSPREFEFFREDLEAQNGVVFARSTGGSSDAAQDGHMGSDQGFVTLRNALDAYLPRRALFLSPYRGMAADAAHLVENGADVRTAGPMPVRTRNLRIPIADLHRSDSGFRAMLEASRHADFGDPVYLRLISSPHGGKWQKRWCVFQSCRKAAALLDSPLRRVYVAATRAARSLHVSITLKTQRNATGHLLVAPRGSRLQDDLFLVGTGGTLADDPLLNQPGVYGKSDNSMLTRYSMLTRPAGRSLACLWGNEARVTLSVAEQRFYDDLFRAIDDSSRSRSGICLDFPTD